MLEAEGFKDYIKKYQQIPNHERLNKIIEDIIKSGRIQKAYPHTFWQKLELLLLT